MTYRHIIHRITHKVRGSIYVNHTRNECEECGNVSYHCIRFDMRYANAIDAYGMFACRLSIRG